MQGKTTAQNVHYKFCLLKIINVKYRFKAIYKKILHQTVAVMIGIFATLNMKYRVSFRDIGTLLSLNHASSAKIMVTANKHRKCIFLDVVWVEMFWLTGGLPGWSWLKYCHTKDYYKNKKYYTKLTLEVGLVIKISWPEKNWSGVTHNNLHSLYMALSCTTTTYFNQYWLFTC